MAFCAWLTSLRVKPAKYVHLVVNDAVSLFSVAGWYSLVQASPCFYTRSSLVGTFVGSVPGLCDQSCSEEGSSAHGFQLLFPPAYEMADHRWLYF